jgi:hypothetical protein
MAAVGAVIGLALVMVILLRDFHPVAGAAGRAPLVKGGRDERLGSDGGVHRSSSRLMQRARAASCAGGLQLARGCWRGIPL